jgi:putative chitinase
VKINITQDTVAKKRPISAYKMSSSQVIYLNQGKHYPIKSYEEAEKNHYLVELAYNAGTWYFYKGHVSLEGVHLVTKEQLSEIMPYATPENIEKYHDPLNNAMREFEIDTPLRISAFIAQIAHETLSLKYDEEIASGKAYEGREDLGNIYPGDGKRYKGRSLIHLTGRANYEKYGRILSVNLEANPKRAKEPHISARIAGLYWDRNGLNQLADQERFEDITLRINGGYNGLSDRKEYYERAKSVLL